MSEIIDLVMNTQPLLIDTLLTEHWLNTTEIHILTCCDGLHLQPSASAHLPMASQIKISGKKHLK